MANTVTDDLTKGERRLLRFWRWLNEPRFSWLFLFGFALGSGVARAFL